MAHYEIRLIRQNSGPLVMLVEHISNFAAVRSARALMQPGDGLEVWNDEGCVYSSPAVQMAAPALNGPA